MPAYTYNPNDKEPLDPNNMKRISPSNSLNPTPDPNSRLIYEDKEQLPAKAISDRPSVRMSHAINWAKQFDVPPEIWNRVEQRLREREHEILMVRDSYDMCQLIRRIITEVQLEGTYDPNKKTCVIEEKVGEGKTMKCGMPATTESQLGPLCRDHQMIALVANINLEPLPEDKPKKPPEEPRDPMARTIED